MLQAEDVSYRYPGSARGISHVNLQAHAGRVTALVGPSGSGKSTVLACLASVLRPDEGRIIWNGIDASAAVSSALITQNSSLFEDLSLWENVALAFGPPRRASRRRAVAVLQELGMRELADSAPSALSLGQRQRVAIAAAIAREPDVILADEPTGSLDEANGRRVMAALRTVADRGSAVLIATHDPQVMKLVDAVVTLESEGGGL